MADNPIGQTINLVVWLTTAPTILTVAARLYCRLKLKPNAGWDDLAIVISLIVTTLYGIICTEGVAHGVGKHINELQPHQALQAGKWIFINASVAMWSYAVPKIAISLLLARLFAVGSTTRMHQLLLFGPTVLLFCWGVATFFLWIFQCSPVQAFYDMSLRPTAKCLNPWIFVNDGIAYSAFSALLDFGYAFYPAIFISQLQMKRRRKIGMSLMMGLGVGGGVAAIYKITHLPLLAKQADPTYNAASLYWTTAIESNLIMLAACVPTLHPLMKVLTDSSKSVYDSRWRTRRPTNSMYHKFSGHEELHGHGQPTPISERLQSGDTGTEIELDMMSRGQSPTHQDVGIGKQVDITVEHESSKTSSSTAGR